MEDRSSNFNDKYRKRTKVFAVKICRLANVPFKDEASRIICRQLIRSGTSLAANFRAASRSRSIAEYFSKLCIVVEETDETLFWLEILEDSGFSTFKNLIELKKETEELLRIFSSTRKTLKQKKNSPTHKLTSSPATYSP